MFESARCSECRHLLPGGHKCHALALKDKPYCQAHLRHNALTESNRARRHSVALPPLEDRAAIQMSIDEVLAAFAARKITRREAGTYLWALQMASRNLDRLEQIPPPPPLPTTVGEHGHLLAAPAEPETPISSPAAPLPADPPSSGALPDAPILPAGSNASDTPEGAPEDPHEGTHEHDPEPPLPLTRKQIRERRQEMQRRLRNYYEARRYYSSQPADSPGTDCALVLAYLKENIEKLEAELEALNRQDAPDKPDMP